MVWRDNGRQTKGERKVDKDWERNEERSKTQKERTLKNKDKKDKWCEKPEGRINQRLG